MDTTSALALAVHFLLAAGITSAALPVALLAVESHRARLEARRWAGGAGSGAAIFKALGAERRPGSELQPFSASRSVP